MISGISGGVLAVLIGFIAIYKIRKRRKTQNRLRLINSLRIDNNNSVSSDPNSAHALLRQSTKDLGPKFNPYMYIKHTMKTIPVDNRREVKRSSFEVGEQIGAGNFSNVCRGVINGLYDKQSQTPAAIKMLKIPVTQEELDNMLGEIKVLGHVKPHLNLVSMIGSCTSEFKKYEQMWILLEFCEYGDLRNYLLGNRWNILSGADGDAINSRCLIKWAFDIANGMHYLANKNIMHGDLAARNILLDEDPLKSDYPLAKISDFGLAKQFYNNVQYEKSSRMEVPWKWMAFEYLTEEYFTLKSDVWSFGILFWELLSFGRTPYGFQEYSDVIQQLESGFRLQCPKEVQTVLSWSPQILYQTLSDACFDANPENRASFSDVVEILEKELTEKEIATYVQMSELYQSAHTENYLKFGRYLSSSKEI